jgi:hypothetical protein
MGRSTSKAKRDSANDAKLRASYSACRDYFADARAYLDAIGPVDLPDISRVVATSYPQSSILKPESGTDATGPLVSAFIEFKERTGLPQPTKPYLFDPWWFAIMRWLELNGRRFRINTSTPKGSTHPLYYVNYTMDNFSFRRIIMNPPKGKAVPDRGNYHDYRAITLRKVEDLALLAVTDYDMNPTYRDQQVFIKLIAKDFKTRLAGKRNLPGLNITRKAYLEQIARWFDLADQMFARNYLAPDSSETSKPPKA